MAWCNFHTHSGGGGRLWLAGLEWVGGWSGGRDGGGERNVSVEDFGGREGEAGLGDRDSGNVKNGNCVTHNLDICLCLMPAHAHASPDPPPSLLPSLSSPPLTSDPDPQD